MAMKTTKAAYSAPEIRRINLAAVELASGSCKSVPGPIPGTCKISPTQNPAKTLGS
jgi:hypothetical protein